MNTTIDFHQLAKEGKLNTLDPSLLTQENLTVKNNDKGNNEITPLHWAAYCGYLNQIPNSLLTQKNLTVKDNNGDTPYMLLPEMDN
jgi:ankyrin repeat protein